MNTRTGERTLAKGSRARILAAGLLAAGMMATSLMAYSPAWAADTFTVDRTIDVPDANVGDGDCDVDPAVSGFQCTLRAAIQEANATAEPDLIRFFIQDAGGTGVKTIDVGLLGFGALPAITNPVTIDGYTQTGASPNTKAVGNDAVLKIELNGRNVLENNGLEIKTSDGSLIRGLAINRFGDGITISGDSVANRIEGNFIGTDPTGTLDRGNLVDGVGIFGGASENVVGGMTPAARNVVSGNDQGGIFVSRANVNRIQGNYIGTDKNGTKDLGNIREGVVVVDSFRTLLGGSTAASRNVISGNDRNGVVIVDGSEGTQVLGNRVGTAANGTGALGNEVEGVIISGSVGTSVGDGGPGGSNTIAFNGGEGVNVSGGATSTDNDILRNSIFSNGGLGIDLSGGVENASGATANDPGDADSGSNTLQNKPVLSSAKTVSGKTTVQGSLSSTPNRTFLVQFYSNPSGNEGKTFLGEKVVATNGSGNVSFSFSPASAVAAGQTVTATATGDRNGPGGTSEFSAARKVVAS